jgi:hypothetical protein
VRFTPRGGGRCEDQIRCADATFSKLDIALRRIGETDSGHWRFRLDGTVIVSHGLRAANNTPGAPLHPVDWALAHDSADRICKLDPYDDRQLNGKKFTATLVRSIPSAVMLGTTNAWPHSHATGTTGVSSTTWGRRVSVLPAIAGLA